MRTPLFVCVAASVLVTAGAHAADMRGMPPPMMEASPGWTGCYVGGHLRLSSEDSKTNTFNTVTGTQDRRDVYNKTSAHDDLQLGCDFAMSSRVVVGGVADVSSGERRDQIFSTRPAPYRSRLAPIFMLKEPSGAASATRLKTSRSLATRSSTEPVGGNG